MAGRKNSQKANSSLCSVFECMDTRLEGLHLQQPWLLDASPRTFQEARNWFRKQAFVRQVIFLRMAFFNFGFQLLPNPADGSSTSTKTFKEWKQDNWRVIVNYVLNAWQEWCIADNVIGVWRITGGRPLVYPPEKVQYKDEWGNEILKIQHSLTTSAIRGFKGLSRAEREAFLKFTTIEIRKGDDAFGFDVLKRGPVGEGLTLPSLASIFMTCGQYESMEVGDAQLAAAARSVYEQHQMGHETRYGVHAGTKINFVSQTRQQAVERKLASTKGHQLLTTNFDHKILWPRPDIAHYGQSKFEAALYRLAQWGLPLAQMLTMKSLNPYLLVILKTQAQAERDLMKLHLETVLGPDGVLEAPCPVRVQWSGKCFTDPRIAADMLKFGLQSGPVSQTTFLDENEYDPATERKFKQMESDLPSSQTQPLTAPFHGSGLKNQPGRKRGTADNDSKK